MKLAITGKGGVGKTTLTALLAQYLRRQGQEVLLVDADPTMNLASVLGIPEADRITPISEMKSLIQERMGTDPDAPATYFRMNPRVEDIPDAYCVRHEGLRLIAMGTIPKGGGGCACAINAFVRALVSHLVLYSNEWVLLDMEAGIEHLGRGTASGVDHLLIVVEPSLASIETGRKIAHLAKEVGIAHISVVGNKLHDEEEKALVQGYVDFGEFAGYLPADREILRASMGTGKRAVLTPELLPYVEAIFRTLGYTA